MTAAGPPFFVYGTLLPGRRNHDRILKGRTAAEQPAVLPGALLYEGPGYPYAIEGHGTVHGALVTAAPGLYAELLALLDQLEGYLGPGHPRNLYERVAREAVPDGPQAQRPVRAWVYFAPAPVADTLRTGGTVVPEGKWLTGRTPPEPRTP